jgi:hypothetical protein
LSASGAVTMAKGLHAAQLEALDVQTGDAWIINREII